MTDIHPELITKGDIPQLQDGTLVLAFSGWMDGGDVSTGTVERLLDLLNAEPIAEVDPERFYIINFPGSMELASLFRPEIDIEDGQVQSFELSTSTFYVAPDANVALFVGKEPNMAWRTFGDAVFALAHQIEVSRILFVGSFSGSVPHTREPRLYVTCSTPELLDEMLKYGVRRTSYEGPGSFTTYLMTRAESSGFEMTSLVAEIPGYLQGTNPLCIEAVTRRLAKILKLPLDLDSLRSASTDWELEVSTAIEANDTLAERVRELEEKYDDDLLEASDEE